MLGFELINFNNKLIKICDTNYAGFAPNNKCKNY